jgi:DNA-binding transcriptional LysR family regulator
MVNTTSDSLYPTKLTMAPPAHPLWSEPLVVAVPPRHPLLAYRYILPEELLRYPLVLFDSQACEGHALLVNLNHNFRGDIRETLDPVCSDAVFGHRLGAGPARCAG